jgi:hypothetical protein
VAAGWKEGQIPQRKWNTLQTGFFFLARPRYVPLQVLIKILFFFFFSSLRRFTRVTCTTSRHITRRCWRCTVARRPTGFVVCGHHLPELSVEPVVVFIWLHCRAHGRRHAIPQPTVPCPCTAPPPLFNSCDHQTSLPKELADIVPPSLLRKKPPLFVSLLYFCLPFPLIATKRNRGDIGASLNARIHDFNRGSNRPMPKSKW